MINWRRPEELPHNGQMIFAMVRHWKKQFPCSYEIYGCSFMYVNPKLFCTDTHDESGKGAWGPSWPGGSDYLNDDIVEAWVPADEIGLPDWLKKD